MEEEFRFDHIHLCGLHSFGIFPDTLGYLVDRNGEVKLGIGEGISMYSSVE